MNSYVTSPKLANTTTRGKKNFNTTYKTNLWAKIKHTSFEDLESAKNYITLASKQQKPKKDPSTSPKRRLQGHKKMVGVLKKQENL
jgi:hypothetical protein